MVVVIIKVLIILAGLYILCGLLFAIAFITKGITQVDKEAHGATIGFRIIIIPATIVFWPFLLKKWIRAVKNKDDD